MGKEEAVADAVHGQDHGRRSAPVTEIAVTGMSCGNCARHVSEALQSVSGVRTGTVSLDTRTASIRWRPGAEPDLAGVIRAVEGAGYGAKVIEAESSDHSGHRAAGWQLNLWIGVLGT